MLRLTVLVLALLLVGTPPPASAVPSDPPRAYAAAKTLVRAKVDLSRKLRGPRVPASFVGVSYEWNALSGVIADFRAGNPVFARLLRDLRDLGTGPPVLRLGGGSTLYTWWNPDRGAAPPGFYYDLTHQRLAALRDVLDQAGALAIPGLNNADTDPRYAVDQAVALQAALGDRVLAYEIGNEPGGYPEFTRYTDEQGTEHRYRPAGWGPGQYVEEVRSYTRALNAAGITGTVAAPATDPRPEWIAALPRIDAASEARERLLTVHEYPLSVCPDGPIATRDRLLTKGSTIGSAKRVGDAIKRVRAAGRSTPVRVSETNSASCGGIRNGSDTFAAALWGIDELFSFAAVGARGADFHSTSPHYQPFGFARDAQGKWMGVVRPLYFAMRVFAEATGGGGRLIPSVHFGQRSRPGATIQLWGVHHRRRREVRVVAVYRQGPGSGMAQVRVPRAARKAQLRRLEAPHVYAKDGVEWAGRGFPAVTRDGALEGTERTSTVRRRSRSRFRFRMVPGTAAMLTVKLRR